jgi:hypothetical protein
VRRQTAVQNIQRMIELWVGGEHSEDPLENPFWNAGKGLFTDPGRSGAVYSDFIKEYNETNAASEVS